MAQYIQSNILFESYTNIDANYDEAIAAIEASNEDARAWIERKAKYFLYNEVLSAVDYSKGSLKAKATIRGTLWQCLPAKYVDFHAEVNRLYWFAKRLSDASMIEFAFTSNSAIGAISYTEARPGIIGKTKRILDSAKSVIEPVENEKKAKAQLKRIAIGRRASSELLRVLADEKDFLLIKSEFLKAIEPLSKSRFEKIVYRYRQQHIDAIADWKAIIEETKLRTAG